MTEYEFHIISTTFRSILQTLRFALGIPAIGKAKFLANKTDQSDDALRTESAFIVYCPLGY